MEVDRSAGRFLLEEPSRNVRGFVEESERADEPIARRVRRDRGTGDDRRCDPAGGVLAEDVDVQMTNGVVNQDRTATRGMHEVMDGVGGIADGDEEDLYSENRGGAA